MKKYLMKLFKRMTIVDDLQTELNKTIAILNDSIKKNPIKYIIRNNQLESCYQVFAVKKHELIDLTILIKTLPYKDDPDYAHRCAEELLDKLTEEI